MNNNDERYVIDLTPHEDADVTQQVVTENPVIIIERDTSAQTPARKTPQPRVRWRWVLAVIAVVICVCGYAGWRYYMRNYYVGLPVSCSPKENIEKLKGQPLKGVRPEVVMTSDSIGGVALNMYELRGLRAELTFEVPDSTDESVYLYSRCADYDKQGKVLGTMVKDGEVISSDNKRLGYCAMSGGKTVLGVARDEAVADFVKESGGSMFRQFVLVSDGEIPRKFQLHKKVERRALARMEEQLYYIESRNAETMWDFADAIRKYGFIDAIYITGGNAPSFYRTADGQCHVIGEVTNVPSERNRRYAPYLVFRK